MCSGVSGSDRYSHVPTRLVPRVSVILRTVSMKRSNLRISTWRLSREFSNQWSRELNARTIEPITQVEVNREGNVDTIKLTPMVQGHADFLVSYERCATRLLQRPPGFRSQLLASLADLGPAAADRLL